MRRSGPRFRPLVSNEVQQRPMFFHFLLTGKFTKLDWSNPHVYFSVEAKGEQGQVATWLIECQPPNFFVSRKISKADFEKAIGQTVAVEVSPAREGSPNGVLRKITLRRLCAGMSPLWLADAYSSRY